MNLRERQKLNRRRRILDAAHAQFLTQGYHSATIESIAEQAEVSAVTVYNYYGNKANLLLALVAQNDSLLIERVRPVIETPPPDLIEAVSCFAGELRAHAAAFLTKPLWRQVIAASIVEGSSGFGRDYASLDQQLAAEMRRMLLRLQALRQLRADVRLDALADSLFHLQNARFIEFIASDDLVDHEVDRLLRLDLLTLLTARP